MAKEQFFTDFDAVRKAYYEKHYCEDKKSWREIAKMLDTNSNRVRRDAAKLGIESRSRSDAQKLALSQGRQTHPTEGKKLSSETKLKISESQGKVWDKMTEEEREYRSQIGTESWNKKTEYEKSDFFKKASHAVQQAARNGSKVELYLFDYLVGLGYKVDRHKEYVLQNDKFHIDLYLPSCRTAIEIDGPIHFEPVFGETKLQKIMATDSQKNGLILSADMVLIRVKLNKRGSQRYLRKITDNVIEIINRVEEDFPNKNERYFEV